MATPGNIRTFFCTQTPNLWSQYTPAVAGDVSPITLGTYQYGVMTKANEDSIYFKRHRTTGVTTTFLLSTIPGNPLNLPFSGSALDPTDGENSHWSWATCRDGMGYLWLVGNSHASQQRLVRSTNPDDITSWTVPTYQFSGSGANFHTYNMFVPRADGTVLWWFDQQEAFDSRGRDILGYYRTINQTGDWTPIFAGGEFQSTRTSAEGNPYDHTEAERAYMCGAAEINGAVWYWGIFRMDGLDPDTAVRPFVAYSTDLITWRSAPNPAVTATSAFTDLNDLFFRVGSAPVYARTQARGIGVDANGPHMVMQDQSTTIYNDYRFDGAGWTSDPIVGPGSTGAPCVNTLRGNDGSLSQFTLVTSGVPRRPRFRNTSTGLTFQNGEAVPTGAWHTPDPVALMAGIVENLCPDGDTPVVYQFAPDSTIAYA